MYLNLFSLNLINTFSTTSLEIPEITAKMVNS